MTDVELAVLSILTIALGGVITATVTLQVQTRNRVDTLADRLGDAARELAALSVRFEDHERRVSHS